MIRAIVAGSLVGLDVILCAYAAFLLLLLAENVGQGVGLPRGATSGVILSVTYGGMMGGLFRRAFKGSEKDPD